MSSTEQALRTDARPDVLAAGCVVLRRGTGGHEVLLVHRPRYDDWSFPKGKLDRGETLAECAVREVLEESGVSVDLGLPLATQRYPIANGRPKRVHYWVARVSPWGSAEFEPNDEVDEIRWVGWEDALALLTYDHDLDTLAEARTQRRPSGVFVLVRPAESVSRKEWAADHPDADPRLRPFTEEGLARAQATGRELECFPAGHLVAARSGPGSRTPTTGTGDVGARVWVPVRTTLSDALSRSGSSPRAVADLVASLILEEPAVVLVAPRSVLPQVGAALGLAEQDVLLTQGAWVAVHHRAGTVLAIERRQEPRPVP